MKCSFVSFLILTSVLFCFSYPQEDKILSRLSYADFCSDVLKDHRKAINVYNEVILAKSGNDSLGLVAETERIELLYKVGQRDELLRSLKEGIALAQKLKDYEKCLVLL
jgi:tetratricopeptide (TPR) repeat protein